MLSITECYTFLEGNACDHYFLPQKATGVVIYERSMMPVPYAVACIVSRYEAIADGHHCPRNIRLESQL